MKKLDVIAAALVIIGALNWGLAGTIHLDLVAAVVRYEIRRNLRAQHRSVQPGRAGGTVSGAHLEIDSAPLAR